MLLEAALPELALPAEEIDAVIADAFVGIELRAPDAVAVLILVEEDLPVQPAQLLRRVDVEEKHAAGAQRLKDAAERAAHVLRLGDVVQTVEQAEDRVDRLRKTQALHRLPDKERGMLQRGAFLRGDGEHLLGAVGGEHAIAALRQQNRQRAGPAGKVEHRLRMLPGTVQNRLQKAQCFGIGNVFRQPVIGGGKRFICHFVSPSSCRSRSCAAEPCRMRPCRS